MFEVEKKKGNDLYLSVTSPSVNKSELKTLKEAELHYLKAFVFAQNNDEKSSIQKNLMMVELKRLLANNIEVSTKIDQFNLSLVRYYEAKAFAEIEECKPKKWIEDLDKTIYQYFNDMCRSFMSRNYEYPRQVVLLNQFKDKVEDKSDQFKCRIFYHILKTQMKIIQQFKDDNNFNRAENEHIYYSQNVQNALQIVENCSSESIKNDIKKMHEELPLGLAEYEAVRLLRQGNQIFDECLKLKAQSSAYKMIDSEDIWGAIDAYKSLIKNYEGSYLLLEGESFAKLGIIQQEMFGNQSVKFREYIHSAVTLGLTKDAYCSESWFTKAKSTLQNLQKEEILRDQALREQWRTENKELYDQIQAAKSSGAESFIKWILINHKSPNQDAAFTIQQSDYSNMKKTLLKVIRLYHSDKIVNETEHFKNVAREIMFVLNQYFETYK